MAKKTETISPADLIQTTRAIKHSECETLIEYLDLIAPNSVWAMDLDGKIYRVNTLVYDNKNEPVCFDCSEAFSGKHIALQLQHVSLIY